MPGVIGTEALAGELSLDGGIVAGGAGGAVVAALGIVRVGAANKESAVPRRSQHSDVVLAIVLEGIKIVSTRSPAVNTDYNYYYCYCTSDFPLRRHSSRSVTDGFQVIL